MATKPKQVLKAKSVKAKPAKTSNDAVGAFMRDLDHPLKADIESVRKLVLGANPAITEGVKWNSVSFRKADWFATINLRSRDTLQLVFHTGAKAKDNPEMKIPDPNGLIKWLAKDRCLVTLGSGKALKGTTGGFKAIVQAWLKYV